MHLAKTNEKKKGIVKLKKKKQENDDLFKFTIKNKQLKSGLGPLSHQVGNFQNH